MKRLLLAAIVAASFAAQAGEPQGPKSVMANSYGVLTAPTNFFTTNATAIAAALAPWLGGGALTNVTLLTYGDETTLAPNSLKLTAGAGLSLSTNVSDLVVAAPVIPNLTNAPALLYGATSAYLPNALKLTAGANITLSTNGQNLEIAGSAGGAGTGTVTHATGPLTLDLPVLGNGGDDLKSVSAATFRAAVDLEPGVDVMGQNVHLEDLASDGILPGTKVGPGIDAENIGYGLLDNARLSTSVTLDTDWDSSVEIAANLPVGSKTGTGKVVFNDTPELLTPIISSLLNANHIHQGASSGGYLSADAIFSGTFNSNRFTRGMITAANTLIVDAINGDDITGARGRSDFPFQTLTAAVEAMQSGDTILMRPGTNIVSVYTNDFLEATQYEAPIVISNKSNWSIIGEPGSVIQADDHGTIMLVDASSNWKIDGLTFRGAGTTAVPEDAYFAAVQLYRTNSNFTVTRCTFEDIGEHGIATLWGQRGARYFRIANNFGTRIGNTNSVLTYDGTFIAVSGREGIIEGNVGNDILRGIEIEGSQGLGVNISVRNNIIHDVWNIGIMMFGNSTDPEAFRRIDISGNQIRGVANTHPCWAFGGFGITWEGNASGLISGNTISRFILSGLNVYSPRSTTIRDLVIVGNVVSEVGDAGIQVIPYPGFTNQVMDCVIANNSVRAAATEGGIRVGGIGHRVTGNIVTQSQGPGITTYTNGLSETRGIVIEGNTVATNGTYGIVVAQGSVGTVLRGNTFAGNTSGTVSDSGTGTLINTFETIGTTANPDIDAALDAKLSTDTHDTLAADYLRLSSTNALGSFLRLQLFGNVEGPAYTVTDPSWTMDWDSITNKVRIIVTNDFQVSEINVPTSGFKTGTMIELVSPEESAEDWLIDVPWSPNANRAHPVLQPGKRLFLFPWYWVDGTLYSFEGDQSLPLNEGDGGTGSTNGVALAPRWGIYHNVFYNQTNLVVLFGSGSVMADADGDVVKFWTNIMVESSSGRPPSAWLESRQSGMFYNTNAPGTTNYIRVRDEWRQIGFEDSLLAVEGGTVAQLEWFARGPNESGVTVVNRMATTASVGGGGSPPAENSLTNGLVAYYNFEQTGTSTLTNAVPGGTALNLVESGGAWTKGVAGVIGNGWTNTVTTRVLSNDASGLRFGRSGESYSASYWYNSATTTTRYMIGEWDNSPEFGWYGRLASGSAKWQLSVSSDGTTVGASVAPSSPAVTAGLHHIVDVFDNENDVIRKYVDGVEIGNAAFAGDINDSTAPFMLGGVIVSGAYNSIQAMFDELALYNRAVSSSEVELLYNGGSGTNLNLILNP